MTVSRTLLVAAAFCLAALCLAACASDPKSPARTARNPDALYPLRADPTTDQIALAIHADGLSLAQVEALKALAARRIKLGGGTVTLSAPGGSADAGRIAAAARAVLVLDGVSDAEIQARAYDAADPKAPLLISFAYDKAEIAECGRHWDQLTHVEDNRVQSEFGCSVTANMAAQIANPSDLRHPRDEDPADAERRSTVMQRYATGKVTAADEPDMKGGVVSRVAP